MLLTKLSISEKLAIKEYYDSYGYVIIENLLSQSKIEEFLISYEIVKHSSSFVFFSQDTHLPSRPRLTPEGFIENSMLNPASLKLWKQFSQSVEECLVDEGITTALSILSGVSKHVMMQNMFFDKSTGTIEHQDHYYLDSDPPGRMIAVWYALEDIHKDAGCFFVLPGSHKGKVVQRKSASNFSDHDAFVKEIAHLINEGKYEYRSFPLKKGDVLFWHPYTIHGAYNNRDPRFSRKSLTAHYYPANLNPLYAGTIPTVRKTSNSNISILGSERECYVSNVMHYVRYIANYIRGRGPDYDMRRNSYE
ncbi:phytanoyl-CoA dioxygenase family protein [Pseudanabaena sp. PCC 6802]|uniref:phytanoyl-CoA dioxygenase family protein n=1 Tax=Pseudanabaena sp. PCC 6802 TaxID=118173 RepID=UPI000344F91A|nr:phytanoyl-CoA dioxygenase family protein [Pseudanabaena sp. PCC 6802]